MAVGAEGYALDKTGMSRQQASSLPVVVSQSRTVVSLPPEASRVPSGLNAIRVTAPVCPCRLRRLLPVAASHNQILSPPELATTLPSGRKAQVQTHSENDVWTHCPVSVFPSFIVFSSPGLP